MAGRLKNYLLIALGLAVLYFLLSYHIIITSATEYDLLKKKEMTLKHTFYSLYKVKPYEALRNDTLREAGIGPVLVKRGVVSQEELKKLLRQLD